MAKVFCVRYLQGGLSIHDLDNLDVSNKGTKIPYNLHIYTSITKLIYEENGEVTLALDVGLRNYGWVVCICQSNKRTNKQNKRKIEDIGVVEVRVKSGWFGLKGAPFGTNDARRLLVRWFARSAETVLRASSVLEMARVWKHFCDGTPERTQIATCYS